MHWSNTPASAHDFLDNCLNGAYVEWHTGALGDVYYRHLLGWLLILMAGICWRNNLNHPDHDVRRALLLLFRHVLLIWSPQNMREIRYLPHYPLARRLHIPQHLWYHLGYELGWSHMLLWPTGALARALEPWACAKQRVLGARLRQDYRKLPCLVWHSLLPRWLLDPPPNSLILLQGNQKH